jgi:hypothetical protein
MEPEIFSSDDGTDAQAKFQRWQAGHPTGFYINRKTATQGMLHRVGCGHLGGPGEWDPATGDLAKRAKVCHSERDALMRWAEKQGVTIIACADCRP